MGDAGKFDPHAVRFRAFVSYSHADAAVAKKLHRKIETYRLPQHLRDRHAADPDNGRMGRIFRDREDLPAAEDLSESVKQALAGSEVLVVICSPDARASIWVAREIELFRALHPGRPVLAALVRGEPEEAFPAPLLEGAEPLAADLRKEGDGWRLGFLKIVAGIAEVPLDALVQRDASRRIRRVMAVTGGALIALLAMIGMTIFAIQSRNEAQHQQAEAEGLVEYMLTDLRTELKGVGRLDVMTKVNERAMDYYDDQADLSDMPAESLERRARILHAMGEDDEKRGDLDKALAKFIEAHRVTEALLARDPDNPDRIFGHAQSEYWVGYTKFEQARIDLALPYFYAYRDLAGRLIDIEPNEPKWIKEVGYAEGNLCALALQEPRRPKDAVGSCIRATEQFEFLHARFSNDIQLMSDLANRYGWDADAFLANGQLHKAMERRKAQIAILEKALSLDPKSAEILQNLMLAEIGSGEIFRDNMMLEAARKFSSRAKRNSNSLRSIDAKNEKWGEWDERINKLRLSLKGE